MIKKIAIILALVMIVSVVFASCDNKNNEEKNNEQEQNNTEQTGDNQGNEGQSSEGVQSIDGVELQDTADDEDNYFYNPKLISAYRVDDTTVRVKFSLRVFCPTYDATKFIYASSSVFGDKIKAKSIKNLDPKVIGEKEPELYGMTYDVTFESPIPENGYVCFEETVDSDFDGSLDNVFCDDMGAGIYASYRPVEEKAPVAAKKYTNDVIEVPELPTVLLRAYCPSTDDCAIIFEFSKPVACIGGSVEMPGDWQKHIFVCDAADPTPGKNGSWQKSPASDCTPIGKIEVDSYGNIYASKWETVFNGVSLPEEGVFRISENSEYADANNKDEEDDATLGRIVIANDGTPLEASKPGTWDVAHCKYSSSEQAYIAGSSYDYQ